MDGVENNYKDDNENCFHIVGNRTQADRKVYEVILNFC